MLHCSDDTLKYRYLKYLPILMKIPAEKSKHFLADISQLMQREWTKVISLTFSISYIFGK